MKQTIIALAQQNRKVPKSQPSRLWFMARGYKQANPRYTNGKIVWHHPKSGMDSEALAPSNSFCYYDLYANGDTGGWRSFSIDLFIGFVEQVA